jgi:glutamine synthetase
MPKIVKTFSTTQPWVLTDCLHDFPDNSGTNTLCSYKVDQGTAANGCHKHAHVWQSREKTILKKDNITKMSK